MLTKLNELKAWFPAGTAEGERSILDRVFVYVDEIAAALAPPTGSPQLLVGNKGSGKSAILSFSSRMLSAQGVPSVILTPSDFDTSAFNDEHSTGDMVRMFASVFLAAIAAKLSEDGTGWFNGDRADLYRQAVDTGRRSPDFVGRMGAFLAAAAKPLIKLDFNSAFPHLAKNTQEELAQSVSKVIGQNGFYVFVDDTDQIANPDKPNHLNRIWALILAARRLASIIPELKILITLRTEVWDRLKIDPSGQRDQTDHFNSLIIKVKSDRGHVEKVVDRRVQLAAQAFGQLAKPYLVFFDGADARAPYSEDRRSWKDLIAVRSRGRPRDAIQLVNQLIQHAQKRRSDRIFEDDFRAVMPTFSELISKDFAKEVSRECPVADEVLRSFSKLYFEGGAFTLTNDQALKHFESIISSFSVTLYGIGLSQQRQDHVYELWRFFYLCGVLNARVSDNRKKDGYSHLAPERDPTLVSKARWNDMQKFSGSSTRSLETM